MANFFDQFDAPASPPAANFFDQFDAPAAPAPASVPTPTEAARFQNPNLFPPQTPPPIGIGAPSPTAIGAFAMPGAQGPPLDAGGVDPLQRRADDARGALIEAASPQLPAGMSEGDKNLRALATGSQDVGHGLAHLIGMPGQAVNATINMGLLGADKVASIFGGNVPFRLPVNQGEMLAGGLDSATSGVSKDILPDWNDRTNSEKLRGNMVDMASQGAGMGAALTRVAPAVEGLSPLMRTLVAPYLEGAGTAVAADAAAGAGSGVGHTVAQSVAPDNPLLDAALSLAGGGVGAGSANVGRVGADMAQTALMKRIPDYLPSGQPMPNNVETGRPFTQAETEAAARQLQQTAGAKTTTSGQKVNSPEQIAETKGTLDTNFNNLRTQGVPDSAIPTTGLLSENPGLVSAEGAARTKEGVPFINRDQAVKGEAATRVASLQDPAADQAAVRTAAGNAQNDALAAPRMDAALAEGVQTANQGAAQAQGAAVAARGDATVRQNASQALDRAVVDQTYVPARAQKNDLYDAVDPNRTERVSADPVIAAAQRVREGMNALGPNTMPEFTARLEGLTRQVENGPLQPGAPDGNVAIGDLVDLRKYMATARARAQSAGSFELADNIGTLQRAIENTTAASPAATAAGANYRENFAPTFRPGPGDEMAGFTKAIDRDPTRSTTPPDETAGRFLGSADKATALRRVVDASPVGPVADQAASDWLVSDMAKSVMNPDGTVNPARVAAWTRNNSDVLAQFPTARAEVDRIAADAGRSQAAREGAAQRLTAANDAVRATAEETNRGAIGTLLGKDPRDVADSILNAKFDGARQMDEVNRVIGQDAAAQAGWKAAVAEALTRRVTSTADAGEGNYAVAFAALAKQWKGNRDVLARVFSPEEMNTLQQAHTLLGYFKQAEKRATVGSNTANKLVDLIPAPVQLAIRHVRGDLRGGGIIKRMRLFMSLLPNDVGAVNQLTHMAWFNPEVASYLLGKEVREFNATPNNAFVKRAIALEAAGNDTGDQKK